MIEARLRWRDVIKRGEHAYDAIHDQITENLDVAEEQLELLDDKVKAPNEYSNIHQCVKYNHVLYLWDRIVRVA